MPAILQTHKGLLFTLGASIAVALMAVSGVIQDNSGEANLIDGARALLLLGTIAIAIPLIGFFLGGVFRYIAYAFPIIYFCFFKFSAFHAIGDMIGLSDDIAIIIGVVGFLLLGAAATEPFRKRNPNTIAAFIFVITASGAAASLVNISFKATSANSDADAIVKTLTSPLDSAIKTSPQAAPDIIYIVPDRYAGAQTFPVAFNSDNNSFLAALRERGFYVAPNARANYAKTFQSLASTLNMTRLEGLFGALGETSTNRQPLFKMIEDNAVQNTLRSQGYEFTFLGNWWEPSRENRNADINFYGANGILASFNELESTLLALTPVGHAMRLSGDTAQTECRRLKSQLNYLKQARRDTGKPMFIFAHLTIPHAPITMDKEGNCTPLKYHKAGDDWATYQRAYRDYVEYLNIELLDIFDTNYVIDNGRDLIFVVQADEGPYPQKLHANGAMDMFDFTEQELNMKFGIINTLYWDAEKYGEPFLTQTPVNNWRIIFSRVFGYPLTVTDDERSLVFRDEEHIYDLHDITQTLTSDEINPYISTAAPDKAQRQPG